MDSTPNKFKAKKKSPIGIKLLKLWRRFSKLFKTDEDCIEGIISSVYGEAGLTCRTCSSTCLIRKRGERYGRCTSCGTKTSVTAKTQFRNCKQVRYKFAAYWLAENGAVFTANDLAYLLESAYETAWRIHSDIKHTLLTEIERLGIGELVPSNAFGDLIYKRSSETPANQRPIAEEAKLLEETRNAWESSQRGPSGSHTEKYISWKGFSKTNNGNVNSNGNVSGNGNGNGNGNGTGKYFVPAPVSQRLPPNSCKDPTTLSGLEKKFFEALTDELVSIDKLVDDLKVDVSELFSVITNLELEGLIYIGGGNHYARTKIPEQSCQPSPNSLLPPSSNVVAGSMLPPLILRLNHKTKPCKTHAAKSPNEFSAIITFLDEVFHGISRKYLQLYLAWYWFCNDAKKPPISLFRASYDLGSVPGPKLKRYNSPLMVRVCA